MVQKINNPFIIYQVPFVTFKDGKIGVNFGGYNAEAGLGGLLTGNAAHGGLSASAGTPWGQRAAAGLGGDRNGRPAGVAYAGAQANPAVGASAVLAGTTGEQGFAGSEAHADGKAVSKTYSTNHIVRTDSNLTPLAADVPASTSGSGVVQTNYVQKIKPPKKYTLIKSEHDDVKKHQELLENQRTMLKETAIPVKTFNSVRQSKDMKSAGSISSKEVNTASVKKENYLANSGATVIIVNRKRRQRKRAKLPRQYLRATYILQQQEKPQEAVKQQQLLQSPATTNTDSKHIYSKEVVKSVQPPPFAVTPPADQPAHVNIGVNAQPQNGVVFSALQIPIGILRSLQESIGGLGGSVYVQKSIK